MADQGIGITLPIQRGKTGYFAQSFDVLTQVKSNLINLLLTKKGERVFQPLFGSNLQELIFEQMDDEYESRVESAIRRDVSMWMPYLTVREIKISKDDSRNRTYVEVIFNLNTNASVTDSIVLEF
jgi:phage baseplate assembly protein W